MQSTLPVAAVICLSKYREYTKMSNNVSEASDWIHFRHLPKKGDAILNKLPDQLKRFDF